MEQWWNNETFMPDNKWVLNKEEGDNSPMSEFAELNAAVLEIIHNEKRFPSKGEMLRIKCDQQESTLVRKLAGEICWEIDNEIIKDLGGTSDWSASPVFTFSDDSDTGMFTSSDDTISIVNGGASNDFKVHLNGLTAVDFEPLPPSALLSTKGCNKHNTSEKFLNEIQNYE